jgi:hypothetical protein
MLKFNTMTEGEFSVKNSLIKWLFSNNRSINPLVLKNGLHKTIIILSVTILLPMFISSCKTCKCPAYSQIELQKPANTDDSTV